MSLPIPPDNSSLSLSLSLNFVLTSEIRFIPVYSISLPNKHTHTHTLFLPSFPRRKYIMPPKSSVLLDRITHPPSAAVTHRRHHLRQDPPAAAIPDQVSRYHTHAVAPNQCCSAVTQHIAAPVSAVWSVLRRFDSPQAYKHFVKSCHVIVGDGDVGTLREVHVISGLPAANSTERLEILDEERHVISFSVVGGDHRLSNYRSVTTLHPDGEGTATVVVESYVVDVPQGNTREDTCVFVDTIVRCNLQSLAHKAEDIARRNHD